MQIDVQRSGERGSSELGWLHSHFSFSFANYYNPERMGFGALRVLNDDIIEGGGGFDAHPHKNFEIVTIVLEGALEHRDSAGNHGIIRPGELQRISAGSGISHSEHNASENEKAALLQIWLKPKEQNIAPGYEQRKFNAEKMKNKFLEAVSGRKSAESIYLHQDARFLMGDFEKGRGAEIELSSPGHGLYVFIIEGSAEAAGAPLGRRDAAGITGAERVPIKALEKSRILAIEVPMD